MAVKAMEIKRNSAMIVQCFDTFRGFLQKLYAATTNGKGREYTYNFFLTTTGGAVGAGHKAQGAAAPPPLPPAGAAQCVGFL